MPLNAEQSAARAAWMAAHDAHERALQKWERAHPGDHEEPAPELLEAWGAAQERIRALESVCNDLYFNAVSGETWDEQRKRLRKTYVPPTPEELEQARKWMKEAGL